MTIDAAGWRLLQTPPRGHQHHGRWGETQPQHEGPDQPHAGEVPAAQEAVHQDAQWEQQQHTQGGEYSLIVYGGGDDTVTSLIEIHLPSSLIEIMSE